MRALSRGAWQRSHHNARRSPNLRVPLSTAAPRHAPFPDLAAAVDARTCERLRRDGYAVVDGAFGETWCNLLRDDIITLAERRLLGRNATHLVRGGTTSLLEKTNIFETELGAHEAARAAAPRLDELYRDAALRDRLRACVGGPLRSQSLKVQLNHGGGGCFPLHFDGDPALDDRVCTAVLYLNPEWRESDGGHLQLVPFPEAPVEIAPKFDRLVLFSSHSTLHRTLPSSQVRLCLTLWFYRTRPGGAVAPADDAAVEKRLAARYAYRDTWARSIAESHAPGAALDAALAAHAADTLKIEKLLEARGVDVAALGAIRPKEC